MWFTENPWPPMLIAGLAALVCVGLWNQDRRNLYLVWAIVCVALSGGIFAFERVMVTEGERLQGQVAEICDQFRRKDPATLDHFSKSADGLRTLCKTAMDMVEVKDDFHLTDFHTKFTNENSLASVHFRANATISFGGNTSPHPFRCVLGFRKEGGQWKIVEVQRLNPINGDKIDSLAHQ